MKYVGGAGSGGKCCIYLYFHIIIHIFFFSESDSDTPDKGRMFS